MIDFGAIAETEPAGFHDAVALLDHHGRRPWTVMITTPTHVWFTGRHEDTWTGPPVALLDHADAGLPPAGFPDGTWTREAFSLRAFDGHAEIRWIKGHRPVHLPAPPGATPAASDPHRWTPWRRYLIGQGTGRSEGDWSLMASARIGSYLVPVRIQAGQRAVFRVAEVTGSDALTGTVTVIDEVILAIEPDHADDDTAAATREAS